MVCDYFKWQTVLLLQFFCFFFLFISWDHFRQMWSRWQIYSEKNSGIFTASVVNVVRMKKRSWLFVLAYTGISQTHKFAHTRTFWHTLLNTRVRQRSHTLPLPIYNIRKWYIGMENKIATTRICVSIYSSCQFICLFGRFYDMSMFVQLFKAEVSLFIYSFFFSFCKQLYGWDIYIYIYIYIYIIYIYIYIVAAIS